MRFLVILSLSALQPSDPKMKRKALDLFCETEMRKRSGFTHESRKNESKEWYTPVEIFDALGCTFDMDVCSPGKEIVPWIPADRHLTIADDGLTADWEGFVWVNPPYGDSTAPFLKKLSAYRNGIAIVFSRTDTAWFHEYVSEADAVLFIRRRVKFIPARAASVYAKTQKPLSGPSGCGCGSMLVGYGEQANRALERAESLLGQIWIRRKR